MEFCSLSGPDHGIQVLTDIDASIISLARELVSQAPNSSFPSQICTIDSFRSGIHALIPHDAVMKAALPTIHSADYFTEPSVPELIAREYAEPGYCRNVCNFAVGRTGYGHVKFLGATDVRWLDIESIVEFRSGEVWVYRNENTKPPVGKGLNKAAEVTLVLKGVYPKGPAILEGTELNKYTEKLKRKTERQGAQFLSFNPSNGEWKFLVKHFSRFGLGDDDDDDDSDEEPASAVGMSLQPALVVMEEEDEQVMEPGSGEDERTLQFRNTGISQIPEEEIEEEDLPFDEVQVGVPRSALPHSLPAHLRLDPVKMQQMRILFFPPGEEADDIAMPGSRDISFWGDTHSYKTPSSRKAVQRSPNKGSVRQAGAQHSAQKGVHAKHKVSPLTTWLHSSSLGAGASSKQGFLEYNTNEASSILMTQQNKGEYSASKRKKIDGFRLKIDVKAETPVGGHSNNIVDAALFMGRSFRVGWGPNGLLVHSGIPVGQAGHGGALSSLIHFEKVAIDKTVRDDQEKVNRELIDLQLVSPFKLHMPMSRVLPGLQSRQHNLKLRDIVCSRSELPGICQGYEGLVQKQLSIGGLSRSKRIILMHQAMVWHLLSVLFSERETNSDVSVENDEELDGMVDIKMGSVKIDPEAEPLVRRAEFSGWLQESVSNRVQEEASCLKEGNDLKQIFSLLTGRQLDEAVQLAAYRGDVRMACLISKAGGSMIDRADMAMQLETWNAEGLDFNFMEEDRLTIYKLLAGDIEGALTGREIDWKRYLGLLMWYHLAPDTALPHIIDMYRELVDHGAAPPPVPIYIDEGPLEEASNLTVEGRYDLTYHLMLLHASEGKNLVNFNKMFSAFSSTYDPLDYHMAWHQQAILQAIGVLDSKEFHVLYMSFVSQLLCVGECHWAIYIVLHMPPVPDYPFLHERAIKEILCQYCETWSSVETHRQFIEELGIPLEWIHEALAMYCEYSGNSSKALEHLLKSSQWQRGHSLFMTSVAPSLFSASQHSEIWRLAILMEGHKSEIADWDLGAGIYMDFYTLRNLFQDNLTADELDSVERKNASCRGFYVRLKESLCLWGSRFTLNARVTYSKMADELATLLMAENKRNTYSLSMEMSCFDTIIDAPLPEDLRLCRLQDAVSVYTSWLSEIAS